MVANSTNNDAAQHSEHVGQHDGTPQDGALAIGAAEQLVYNNNKKLITQTGESQTKVKNIYNKFWKSFRKILSSV